MKITPEGRVKVLDFGLAKALSNELAAQDPEVSPTLTVSPSRTGVLLGTAGYMSPEQARGLPADKRADIWAFGVILYEMTTGRSAFPGATITDSLASILKSEPDWTALPAGTPEPLRRLVVRCLDKDAKLRLRDIGEARILMGRPIPGDAETSRTKSPVSHSRWPWLIAAATIVALAILVVMYWWATRPAPARAMRFRVDLGPDVELRSGYGGAAVLSPDGNRLVYAGRAPDGNSQLFTRTLDQAEAQATPLPETQNAASPFFSPDGQWVGFFAEFNLKKVRVAGGAPVSLSEAPSQRGGSWSEDGSIIAALDSAGGLSRIPQAGGPPQRVTTLSKDNREVTHRWPQVIGHEAVLFTSHVNRANFDEAVIEVQSLKNGVRKTLHRGGYYGRYVPAKPDGRRNGFLVYLHRSTLYAAPMDPDRLELTGPQAPVLEGVKGNPDTGGAQFDFSRSGILVLQEGRPDSQRWVLDWLDSAGKRQPLVRTPGSYSFPRISPDGSLIALDILGGAKNDVWVYDWRRDRLSRLTFDLISSPTPVCWFPSGKYIALSSDKHGGPGNIYWMRADGAGDIVRLIESTNQQMPSSFSPDGKRLAYIDFHPDTGLDIWTVPLDVSNPDHPKAGQPEPFLRTAAVETYPSFSPDGRWLAYTSTESDVAAIYVRPFPGPGGKWQIAPSGTMPVWSPNGRELFYRTLEDRRIMVVSYSADGDAFVPGGACLVSSSEENRAATRLPSGAKS